MNNSPRPQPLGDETEHYWLVQRMAKATGVDLVRAAQDGLLSQSDWAGVVDRCRACTWAGECRHWLYQPVDDTRDVPTPCRNRKRFTDLIDAMKSDPAKE